MSRTVHQYIKERWNECKAWPLFNLPKELIRSLFYAARKGAPKLRKRHDNAFNLLNQAKLEKLKSAQIDSAEKAVEENIVAMNYFEIGISERRWKTVKEADSVYNQLGVILDLGGWIVPTSGLAKGMVLIHLRNR